MNIFRGKWRYWAVVAIAIVALAWFVRPERSEVSSAANLSQAVATLPTPTDTTKDSDGDGLLNWEEILYGTDPSKADSNGDGVNDTRPLAQGTPSEDASASLSTPEENLSDTEIFSRYFLTEYLSLKQGGVTLDQKNQNALISSALAEVESQRAPLKLNTLANLSVTNTSSEASYHEYGNALGAIILSHKPKGEGELKLIERAVLQKDAKALGAIAPNIEMYRAAYQEFLGVKVPDRFAKEHLGLVNGLYTLYIGLEGVQQLSTDPLHAYVSLNDYQAGTKQMIDSFIAIHEMLKKERVSFASEEPGSIIEILNGK